MVRADFELNGTASFNLVLCRRWHALGISGDRVLRITQELVIQREGKKLSADVCQKTPCGRFHRILSHDSNPGN